MKRTMVGFGWVMSAGMLLGACTSGSGFDTASRLGTPGGGPGGFSGGGPGGMPGGGGLGGDTLGATPGGMQDIGYARMMIEAGHIPGPEYVSVEGLLNEHDLSVEGPPCTAMLCSRPQIGVAPSLATGKEKAFWIQLGMTSGLKADGFRRPPIDLAVVVDKSGGMSIDMAETNAAVVNIVQAMREDDRLTIVAFDDTAHVIHAFGSVPDKEALSAAVRGVEASGGANIDDGLAAGYAALRTVPNDSARLRRVIAFSCGYGSDLAPIIEQGARERIGFTMVGVLVGPDLALTNTLSTARGGSAYFLSDLEVVESLFRDDFDLAVTPLAYDLRFDLLLSSAYRIDRIFGLPGDPDGTPRTGFNVATAFASRGGGAIVARLERVDGVPVTDDLGTVTLSYEAESAHGLPAESGEVDLAAPATGTSEVHFDSAGLRKTVALVNMGEQLIALLTEAHSAQGDAARTKLTALRDYMRGEAMALSDEALTAEVALLDKLLANLGEAPETPSL